MVVLHHSTGHLGMADILRGKAPVHQYLKPDVFAAKLLIQDVTGCKDLSDKRGALETSATDYCNSS